MTGVVGKTALFVLDALWPSRLTVLAYHRVTEGKGGGLTPFLPNISASPPGFREQMEFVKEVFDPVGLRDLSRWLRGEVELPRRPLVITFDDGYRDNMTNALPVLEDLAMPASIFLATGHIGSSTPLSWDLMAHAVGRSKREWADLPLLGRCSLAKGVRGGVTHRFVEAAKGLAEEERAAVFRKALEALDVDVDNDAFEGLYLSWDDVREMTGRGVEFASHTCTHPILTRVSEEQARSEIVESKRKVEEETGREVDSFAYPNGLAGDFNGKLAEILAETGFATAFTLLPGPQSLAGVRREPMAIRRILISYKDNLPRFAAKLLGGQRAARI